MAWHQYISSAHSRTLESNKSVSHLAHYPRRMGGLLTEAVCAAACVVWPATAPTSRPALPHSGLRWGVRTGATRGRRLMGCAVAPRPPPPSRAEGEGRMLRRECLSWLGVSLGLSVLADLPVPLWAHQPLLAPPSPLRLPCCCRRRARRMPARSSRDFACWKQASASAGGIPGGRRVRGHRPVLSICRSSASCACACRSPICPAMNTSWDTFSLAFFPRGVL